MTHDKTQPALPADKLEYAIYLARSGRKAEARDVLRRVVSAQPVNQAAWLWLSGVTDDRTEAEAALAQARQINPTHPSLLQAEKWLVSHFSEQPLTREVAVTTVPIPPQPQTEPSPPAQADRPQPAWGRYTPGNLLGAYLAPESKSLPRLFNLLSLGLVALAIGIAALVLLAGLVVEAGATVPVSPVQPTLTAAPERFMQERPAELDEAWQERDWPRAIVILEEIYRAEPTSPIIKDQLSHAYLQQGVVLRHKGYVEEAMTYFEQALAVTPAQLRAQQEFRLASGYLRGTQYYQAGQWPAAIEALEAVRGEDATYVHVKDLLYSAYYNHGLAQQAAGAVSEAQVALEAAVALRPDLAEPRLRLAEVKFDRAPGTPLEDPLPSASARDKLIVVGILEQRMLVFERNKVVFDFVVSTGEPGRDTALGDFEILNKIDVAYAATWNLDMPYWLGIYWSGPLQNGIHALPIVRHTGYKLWDGYLGQRVSYGCVILSDQDAATLYNWVEIGVPMKIVWSLDDWLSQNGGE